MASYLDRVIEVAQHVPVFPCRAKDVQTENGIRKRKRPHITQYKQKASQDPEQIQRWWKKWPDALVGMPTGLRSGIYAIDMDPGEDEDPYSLIDQLPGPVDEFDLMQRTKRGLHILYELDPDRPLRNGTDVFAENIDTRGEGGYLCIAPSEGYELIGALDDLTPVPEWVYKYLKARVKSDRKKTGDEVQSAATVIKTLMLLDTSNYQSYEDWVKVMLACYHGSGADEVVKEAFKEWSAQDTSSYDDNTDDQIDSQWESAATDIDGIVTYKTLRREMTKEHGAVVLDGTNPFDNDVPDLNADTSINDDDVQAVEASIKLDSNPRGKVEASSANLRKILQAKSLMGEPNQLRGLFRFNEMAQRVEFKGKPPWDPYAQGRTVVDNDITHVRVYLSSMYRVDYNRNDLIQCINAAAAEEESYHPVKKYLMGLEWDKKPRINGWLPDIVNTKNTKYYQHVGRRFLIGAVARAMSPGCQMDTMPVFEGDQGIYKTSMVKILGGDWYRSPNLRDLASKESTISCLGAWFIEVEEMGAIKQTQIDFIKKFVTTRVDAVRFTYDRYASDIPRSFVMVGTMNPSGDNQYIHDVTGARRFWPIECPKEINLKRLEKDRDQLFAEAYHCFKEKQPWHFTEAEVREYEVNKIQAERQSTDPWCEMITDFLYQGAGRNFPTVQPTQIWSECLQGHGHKVLTNNTEANRIKRILVNTLRWEYKSTPVDSDGSRGTSKRRYCRPKWEEDFE